MDLILGHNQFIGISHISEEKSREKEKIFSNIKNIYDTVEKASSLGYKGMMIETHPRMLNFLNYYKKNKNFDIDFYLQVPYVQGYIQKMNEKGLSGLAIEIIKRGGIKSSFSLVLSNIINIAKKDYSSIATSALGLEVAPFRNINIKALFLHNVLTDLLLSLQMQEIFIKYIEYLEDKLKVKPGFITLNFPLFKNSFEKWEIDPPLVMTPINTIGYDMNPSKKVVETSINEYGGEIIAMNVLGGGSSSIRDSCDYLKSFNKIKFCTIGASSEKHLRELRVVFL